MDQGYKDLFHLELEPLLLRHFQDHDYLKQDEQWEWSPLC